MSNPVHLRKCVVVISRADAMRVDALVIAVGMKRAVELIGVGEGSVRSAAEEGRMMSSTRDRLLEGLARAEARAS